MEQTDANLKISHASVLERVRVHADAVIVLMFMLVLVNAFVNMVVNVDAFMMMF